MKIYHNPRCRKSRETLQILNDKGIDPEIVLYLNDLFTEEDLSKILKKLKISPIQLVRKSEAIYKSDYKGKEMSDAAWIKAMVKHPKLIERPIVVHGKKAVLGRPPENVLEII